MPNAYWCIGGFSTNIYICSPVLMNLVIGVQLKQNLHLILIYEKYTNSSITFIIFSLMFHICGHNLNIGKEMSSLQENKF